MFLKRDDPHLLVVGMTGVGIVSAGADRRRIAQDRRPVPDRAIGKADPGGNGRASAR